MLSRHPVSVPKLYNCDVRDAAAWNTVFEENAPVWGVIHLAAMKSVGESTELPLKYYDVNVGGSVALLKVSRPRKLLDVPLMAGHGATWVQASSVLLICNSVRRP